VDRYSAHFRFSGPLLDVDALAARARPSSAHEIWRRGDVLDEGQRARTSGVQVEIGDFDDMTACIAAVDFFLEAEAAFLAAVTALATDETMSVVAIALWVHADEPVSVALEPELLARLGHAGMAIEVTGYPTSED
jgi:hypothetical protein